MGNFNFFSLYYLKDFFLGDMGVMYFIAVIRKKFILKRLMSTKNKK